MSNIYIQEPPTSGKVLLETSVGDIDVELWCRETPRSCRNFIQLCMEGYYNDTTFHRVVPGFIVQGGDPTGTGRGGQSIYDKPFRDEFHSRLRFVRRGLLAMANAGRNDNGSQFFFTLDAAPELQNKHTVFGKVTGNTLFNMLKLGEGEIEDETPVYSRRVIRTEVLLNPFDDIVPRSTPVQPADTARDKDAKPKSKSSATKNFKLLSFGDEAEEDEEETNQVSRTFSSKSKSSHDLANDPNLSSAPAVPTSADIAGSQCEDDEGDQQGGSLEKLRKKLKRDSNPVSSGGDSTYRLFQDKDEATARKISDAKAEYNALKKSMQQKKEQKGDQELEEDHDLKSTDPAVNEYNQNLQEYRQKKRKSSKKGHSREEETMALLSKFKDKLAKAREEHQNDEPAPLKNDDDDEDDPNDESWMWHRLETAKSEAVLARDASAKQDDWYDIYDPRNDMNKRRRDSKKPSNKQ